MIHEEFIKENFSSYEGYLASRKVMSTPFVVSEIKVNHPTSIYAETKLSGTHIFGETTLSCEVKSAKVSDFKIAILSTIIPSRTLFRYDSDGPDHKNKADYIPLPLQSVPTPHYHRFDSRGNLLAYQTEAMKDRAMEPDWKDVNKAFIKVCHENVIQALQSDDTPRIIVNTGSIPFDYGDDPTNGLNF